LPPKILKSDLTLWAPFFITKKRREGIMAENKKIKNSLIDLGDALMRSKNKLRFVTEFFTTGHPGYNFEISETGTAGIHCILTDIDDELESILDELIVMEKRTIADKA
jgi:hypothetical protein